MVQQMNNRSKKLLKILQDRLGSVQRGAEVGVQFGKNAEAMLASFPGLFLYLVDCYDESVPAHPKHTVAEVEAEAHRRLARFPTRFEWLVEYSVVAAKSVPDGSLDYAFIDADHSYESVKQDIIAWLPKIGPGGILAGHDYSARFRGVKRAVNEAFGSRLHNVGDVWWVEL